MAGTFCSQRCRSSVRSALPTPRCASQCEISLPDPWAWSMMGVWSSLSMALGFVVGRDSSSSYTCTKAR